MMMSESVNKIAPALIKFNSQVSKIAKDATNPFHKNNYATLDQIIDEIRPVLNENKLAIMQNVSGEDGVMTVKTTLIHESGEWLQSTGTTLRLAKNDPQGAGAGITYARRYDLCAFLSLNTGDDDDGNSASGINAKSSNEKAVTPKQIGDIKTKALELAKLRKASVDKIYETLKIRDITQITQSHAKESINALNTWIENAKKEQGEQNA